MSYEGTIIPTIRRLVGPAGQVGYRISGLAGSGPLTFYSSVYGGPVVMETGSGMQTFVTDPGRFGEFGEEWVRRFLAA